MSRTRDGLLQVFRLVRPQQNQRAVQRGVARVDVAEHQCFGGVAQSLIACDVELRAQLLSLVAVENAQRDADTGAERLVAYGLLMDGLYVYHALKVGSVEPFATASL